MALITQPIPGNTKPSWSIANIASFALNKAKFDGYSIQRIEIIFTAKPYYREGDRLICKNKVTTTHYGQSAIEEDLGIETLNNVASQASRSYSQMIANFRQAHELLNFTCQVKVIGEKKASDASMTGCTIRGEIELEGNLDDSFWDRAFIGAIRSTNYAEALTDAILPDEENNCSKSPLHLRALDLA